MQKDQKSSSSQLLTAGVIMAPLFLGVVFLEILTRDGFDITKHAISMLSLGPGGWLQSTNFIVAGILSLMLALGIKRVITQGRGRVWGPLLVGVFGVGITIAGIFSTDPSFGFPAGAPDGLPATMSTHAMLHNMGFFTSFTALTASAFVFASRFKSLGQRSWAKYSSLSGYATVLLIVLGMTALNGIAGVCFLAAAIIAQGCVSAIAYHLAHSK